MENQLTLLRQLDSHPMIKIEIEKFMTLHTKTFDSGNAWDNTSKNTTQFIVDFENFAAKLIGKYNVTQDSIGLYISLDKRIYQKMNVFKRKAISRGLEFTPEFDTPECKGFVLTSDEFMTVYKKNYSNIINFLETNIELFPDNFAKYIRNKQKERAKASDLKIINNDFECQVFAKNLGVKPTKSKIEANLKFINNLQKAEEKLPTLFFFHKVVRELEDNERFDTNDILDRACIYFYKRFIGSFETRRNISANSDVISTISKLLSKDSVFTNVLINKMSTLDMHSDSIFFLLNYVRVQEDLDRLNHIITSKLHSDTNNRAFNYSLCSDEIKNTIVIETKRQFFALNPDCDLRKPFLHNVMLGV